MKILVNDIAASSGGAKSILLELYRYLVDGGDQNEWYFLLGEPLIEPTEHIHVILLPKVKKSWLRRLWFDFISGRKTVAQIAPDVVFSMQNTLLCCGQKRQYIYLHQPLPFQKVKKFSFFKRAECVYAVYQYLIGFLIKWSIKRADGVFVQTKWMKQAITRYIPEDCVWVCPPCIDIRQDWQEQAVNIQQNQFFYPASSSIYKNHGLIYAAVSQLNQVCVTDFNVTLTLPQPPATAQSPAQIRWVGTLPIESVMAHYKHQILVFPSYIETFGLPLAEARLMGGMILAADTPFAREILDGYENAWFFDPFCAEQLTDLMKKAIGYQLPYTEPVVVQRTPHNTWAEILRILKENV